MAGQRGFEAPATYHDSFHTVFRHICWTLVTRRRSARSLTVFQRGEPTAKVHHHPLPWCCIQRPIISAPHHDSQALVGMTSSMSHHHNHHMTASALTEKEDAAPEASHLLRPQRIVEFVNIVEQAL